MLQQQLEIEKLETEDLQAVLRRALELDVNTQEVANPHGDLEAFLRAAEEAGVSREATLQALRERLGAPLEGVQAGDRVFAKSADGAFYAATVTELRDNRALVRFHNGGDHNLALTDLRAFSILPGQKIQCNWPSWGWSNGTVESFNVKKNLVRATDGLSSKVFSLDKVRLGVEKTKQQQRVSTLITRVAIFSALAGGALGALLMRFFGG